MIIKPDNVLATLLRDYLVDHDRCSSEDNPMGTRCDCTICRRTRVALRGKRGLTMAALDVALEGAIDGFVLSAVAGRRSRD